MEISQKSTEKVNDITVFHNTYHLKKFGRPSLINFVVIIIIRSNLLLCLIFGAWVQKFWWIESFYSMRSLQSDIGLEPGTPTIFLRIKVYYEFLPLIDWWRFLLVFLNRTNI